jgi:aminopeptidase N
VLANDPFYGVRVAAATSLGTLGSAAAKQSLLAAMSQADSRVRISVVQALGQLLGDADAYHAIQGALLHDPSYAVQAAAARSIGKSNMPDAFDFLQARAAGKPEIHVMRALEAGLAASGDPRAVDLLLTDAQPGMPLRMRLSALAGLAAMQKMVMQDHSQAFTELVSRTLHDPYFPLQFTAVGLVGTLHLMQFKPELTAEAANAPTQWQRDIAQDALDQLQATP